MCESALAIPREVIWDGRGDDGRALPVGIYVIYAGSREGYPWKPRRRWSSPDENKQARSFQNVDAAAVDMVAGNGGLDALYRTRLRRRVIVLQITRFSLTGTLISGSPRPLALTDYPFAAVGRTISFQTSYRSLYNMKELIDSRAALG